MRRAIFAAVAAVLLGGASGKANFIAIYSANFNNVYRYTLRFSVDQPGETLRAGDTVTLYDVTRPGGPAGDVAFVTAPNSPAGAFTVSQQPVGITPADLVGVPGITDSALRQNVTFIYAGPDLTAPQDFVNALVTMSPQYSNVRVGKESGSTEIGFNLSTESGFDQDTSIRTVLLPSDLGGEPDTPEPGSLAVMGLGATALMVRRRKAGSAGVSSLI